MPDAPPVPVQPLEYQFPEDAGTSPWAGVARAVGWSAAAMGVAQVTATSASGAFRLGVIGASFDETWVLWLAGGVLHLPMLIGGIACSRLRPYGWKLLTYSMWGVIAVKLLTVIVAAVLMGTRFAPFGPLGRVALGVQQIFATVASAVPMLLMIWILRRSEVRQLFVNARHFTRPELHG